MSKSNDPYLIENSSVLKNKAGIISQKELESYEYDIVSLRITELQKSEFVISKIHNILDIHEYLFSPLFDWAGQVRTITMYKSEPILNGYSVDYTPASYIEKELDDLENKFQQINWSVLSREEKIKQVASIIQELWQIHCFREGNTRSVTMFLYFLLKKLNIFINNNALTKNAKYFRNALVLASLYSKSKPEYLIGIIKDIVTFKNEQTGKYETIDGYEVEKYSYQNHTIEKIKTVK